MGNEKIFETSWKNLISLPQIKWCVNLYYIFGGNHVKELGKVIKSLFRNEWKEIILISFSSLNIRHSTFYFSSFFNIVNSSLFPFSPPFFLFTPFPGENSKTILPWPTNVLNRSQVCPNERKYIQSYKIRENLKLMRTPFCEQIWRL